MTDAMLDARTQRRHQLRANGYMPLPTDFAFKVSSAINAIA